MYLFSMKLKNSEFQIYLFNGQILAQTIFPRMLLEIPSSPRITRRKLMTSETVTSDALTVSWHRCDVCKNDSYTVYILQLDKWYCVDCIQTASKLLENIKSP